MARTKLPITVLSNAGGPLSGVNVQVNLRGSTAATIYAFETGGTVLANPQTTDAFGRVLGWVDQGRYDQVASDPSGRISSYTEPYDSTPSDALLSIIPPGVPFPYTGLTAPTTTDITGKLVFLMADGSNVSSATYAALDLLFGAAAPVGATHAYNGGASPGAGLFRLPDLQGRSPVGKGTHADVATLGNNEGIVTVAERTPRHRHGKGNISASGGSHSHSDPNVYATDQGHGTNGAYLALSDGWIGGFGSHTTPANTHSHPNSEFSGEAGYRGTAGAGTSPLDAPGYVVTNWIIKT